MTAPRSRVITELVWRDDGPHVRVVDDGSSSSDVVPLVGLRLNYRASAASPRRCLGHRKFTAQGSVHVDCGSTPEPGSRKCSRCRIVDASFATNVHHAHTRDEGSIDPAFAAHLRQPNVLYLAAFRDGSMKVGTSTATRRDQRLAEQGAWRARLVAESADGIAVRGLEDMVTAELGIAQSVAVKRKLDGMVTPLLDARLDEMLDRTAASVGELVAASPDRRLRATSGAWTHPAAAAEVWERVHPYPLDLASGHHDLEVVAALGRLVAVRRPGDTDVFVADLQQVFGVELELGDFASDELAVQDSLF